MSDVSVNPIRIQESDDGPTHRRKTKQNFDLFAKAIGMQSSFLAKKIQELLGSIVRPALIGGFNIYDVRQFGTIAKAIAAIPEDRESTLYITNPQRIPLSLEIPSYIAIEVVQGGYFDTPLGHTLAFDDVRLEAGLRHIFRGAGTVAGTLRVLQIPPEWFGAKGDRTTTDSSTIQKTLDFIEDNYDLGDGGAPDVVFTGTYLCDTGLQVPTRVNLVGSRAHVAGNLCRNAARLLFTGLGTNTKALTIGSDVTIRGLVISGPGEGVSGTYGIYGGLLASEELGSNTQLIDCTVEDFETDVVFSRWLNTITQCCIDDARYGILLCDRANHTVIYDNRINPGSASPKEAIRITGTPEGVFITHNNIESVYYGAVITGGQGVVFTHNRFEIANKAFIDVRGTGGAGDEDIYVDIHHNYLLDYGINASGGGRWGIMVQAGHVTIDDNTIGRYDSGGNTGLQYGINFGAAGVLYHCLIGRNRIDCYQALANINDEATKRKVNSRFVRTIEYLWDLGDDPGNNVEHYFRFPLPDGYSALYSFRRFCAYNIDDIQDAVGSNVAIGELDIGYLGASIDRDAYLENMELSSSAANNVTYATDAEWTAAGTTFLDLPDDRVYLIRGEPGDAVSGRILLTLVMDEFQI